MSKPRVRKMFNYIKISVKWCIYLLGFENRKRPNGIKQWRYANIYLYYRLLSLLTTNWKIRKEGDIKLILNLNNFHEKNCYYNSTIPVIDDFIIKNILIPDDCVLDLGANIGYNSMRFLNAGCRNVYAVEPTKGLYNRLKIIAYQDHRLTLLNCAISDHTGVGRIYFSQTHNQGNTLNNLWIQQFPTVYGKNVKTDHVKLETLDHLSLSKDISFVKIDIEGSELTVFEGGKDFFSNIKPIVQIEIYDFIYDAVFKEIKKYYKYLLQRFLRC